MEPIADNFQSAWCLQKQDNLAVQTGPMDHAMLPRHVRGGAEMATCRMTALPLTADKGDFIMPTSASSTCGIPMMDWAMLAVPPAIFQTINA
jgi:hypothetical protein